MRHTTKTFLTAAVAALSFVAHAQDIDQDMMQKMMPGEMHKMLAKYAGEWDVAVKFRMTPEMEFMDSHADCKAEMILNGGFLRKNYTSEMNGQPFFVEETLGYDGLRGHFFQTDFESMGTGYRMVTGKLGDDKKSIVMEGEGPNPMDGGKPMKERFVYRFVSDDEYVVEWWEPDAKGAMQKMVVLTHTRKKQGA